MRDDGPKPGMVMAMSAAVNGVGGGLGWSLLPPLMPAIAADLAISHGMGGLIWGATPLGIALAAPIGGAAVDRFGPRRVAGIAMLFGALACAARALAVGPWSLFVSMFLFGVHTGFVAPAIPKALAGHVPVRNLGRANGTALLAYTICTAITVLVARTVIAPALGGWRTTMVAAAVAMAVVGVLWMLLVKDRILPSRHAGLRDVVALAGNGSLLRVAAMHFLLFGGYLALLGVLPRALAESGMPLGQVGLAVASWLAVAGAANFLGPWLSDRIARRRPFFLVGAVIAGGALFGLSLWPHATWLLAVAALGGGCFAPLLLTTPLELPGIGPARAGAAMGLLMLIGQAGGFALSTMAGKAAGSGLTAVFGALAVAHLAILLPALGLRETAPRRVVAAPPAAASDTADRVVA